MRLICAIGILALAILMPAFVARPVWPASRTLNDSFPTISWRRSLPVTFMDPAIKTLGGTEARALVTMGGKLYAAIGYWEDREAGNPALPGGQILRLDTPDAEWKVDLELDERVASGPNAQKRKYYAISALASVIFTVDGTGRALAQPVPMLLASTSERGPGLFVFYRDESSSQWSRHSFVDPAVAGVTQIRSFTIYRDKVTGVQRVFAGTSPWGIFSGVYDPAASGKIRWDAQAEPWEATGPRSDKPRPRDRVMSFAECNGRLYATVNNKVYERQNGASPFWRKIYEHPYDAGTRLSGFRGATSIPDPKGHGQILLLALEHRPLQIFRLDPRHPGQAVEDLNVSAFLHSAMKTTVRYGIAAYNNMVSYPNPVNPSCPFLLMGMEIVTPEISDTATYHFNRNAHYLIRRCDGTTEVREIADPTLRPATCACLDARDGPFTICVRSTGNTLCCRV